MYLKLLLGWGWLALSDWTQVKQVRIFKFFKFEGAFLANLFKRSSDITWLGCVNMVMFALGELSHATSKIAEFISPCVAGCDQGVTSWTSRS